jgi:hypothetical protein
VSFKLLKHKARMFIALMIVMQILLMPIAAIATDSQTPINQTTAADPEPVPAADPEPVPAADPEPVPAADPEPVPAADPEPVPAPEEGSETGTDTGETGVTEGDGNGDEDGAEMPVIEPEVGNSYVATVDVSAVGGPTSGLLDKSIEYDFTATFKEVGTTTLGSAQLTIDNNFGVGHQSGTVTASNDKTWNFDIVDRVLSLWATTSDGYLGTDASVSVVFKATTPSAAGVYTFETEAWTTANSDFNDVAGDSGTKDVMADGHYDPSVWVADAGDTINVAAGEYGMSKTLDIDKWDSSLGGVTIKGPDTGTAKIVGTSEAAKQVFNVTAHGATIDGLEVTLNNGYASNHDEYPTALIGINNSGAIIKNNTIYGNYPIGTSHANMFTRGITVAGGAFSSEITGNTIYNVRNGIVVHTGNTALINNNVIFNTKGGIMNYTSNDDDAAKRTMNGNSWASTIPGMIDHNEWDIVWNSATYGFPNYHDSIVKVSEDNYGAYILDLRRDKDAIVKDLVTTHPQ